MRTLFECRRRLHWAFVAVAVALGSPSSAAGQGWPPANNSEERTDDAGEWSWSDPISHKGFVLQASVGTVGCTRAICTSTSRHGADPGVRVAGFVGGNIGGFVELGLAGGWGTLSPRLGRGANLLELYGVDPALLQQELSDRVGVGALDLDLEGLTVVDDPSLRMVDGGPMLRVHFIPRGRLAVHVGAGARYVLLRSRYSTRLGPTRLDFHGVGVPMEGGVAFYPIQHLSVGVRGNYMWTRYLGVYLDNPQEQLLAPVSMVENAAGDSSLRRDLPHFWTVAMTLGANF